MRIGYYAHHHGSGHCRQADKLAALLPQSLRHNLIVFTSLSSNDYHFTTVAEEQIIRLSPEDERDDEVLPGRAGQYWQPECLHYSPVGNSDIQTRSLQILNAIQERGIDLMVIDVSVEVAMLCRVTSVPYLYVRLAGIRDDTPHLNAFAGALGLLAPYPRVLEAAETEDWLKQKTLYLDFLANDSSKAINYAAFIASLKDSLTHKDNKDHSLKLVKKLSLANRTEQKVKTITVIKGYGGHESIDDKLPKLRAVEPDALIISLGPISDDKRPYVDIAIEVSDVTPFIEHSDLLIMACGLNGIAQAYGYDTPLVVLPDDRPHREQEVMAEALITQGRAMSWQHFIKQSTGSQNFYELQTLPTESKSSQNSDEEDKPNITTASKHLMDSFIEYDSSKLWFENWLLPQLGLTPERLKR